MSPLSQMLSQRSPEKHRSNTICVCTYACTYTCICTYMGIQGASLVAQMAGSPPAMHKTQVQPLGWEDRLEKEMATHSSILAWTNSWTEEPAGLQSMCGKEQLSD